MSASARLLDPTMSADQYPLTVIPVIVGLAAFILKKQDTSAEVVRTAMVAAGAFWGAHLLPESPGSSLQGGGGGWFGDPGVGALAGVDLGPAGS